MKDKPLACELPELAADTTRQRIQLYPGPGDYVHPAAGPFTLTADTLAEYADDINARGDRIPLDYDHSPEKGLGTRAAGWFVADTARVEGDGSVTAEVDWTPPAAEAIRNREYRFISPTFAQAHRDMHGKLLEEPKQVGAALTNRPFFNVMQPLAADELPLEDELGVEDVFGADVADTLTTISASAAREVIAAAAAKKPYGNVAYADPGYRADGKARYPIDSEEHVRAAWSYINQKRNASKYPADQLKRIKARIRRAASKFGVTIGADETTKEKTMELTEALAADLGVAVDADDETILAAMERVAKEKKDLEAKQASAPAVTAAEVAELKAEIAASKTERIDSVLDKAVGEFKIAAADRTFFAEALERDFAGTKKFLEEKPAVVQASSGHGQETVKVGDIEVNVDDVKIAGVDTPVDVDSAKLVAATESLIRKAGKDPSAVTADEYASFAMQASKDPNLTLSLA